jgi:hypothetical protein
MGAGSSAPRVEEVAEVSYYPLTVTISYPNGSYEECLRQRRAIMLWLMTSGLRGRNDIDGKIGTAYWGLDYDKSTIEDPLDSGWCAYVAFWCAFPESEEWLRSRKLPDGMRFADPDSQNRVV